MIAMDWYTGKQTEPLLEGEKIMIGGQEFIIAPFKLKEWISLAPVRKQMRDAETGSVDDLAGRVAYIHMALSRNYPDLTARELLENCNPIDLEPALAAVIRANDFMRAAAGEAGAPALNGAAQTEVKTGAES